MNDSYYFFALEHSIIENGIRIANIESLIVLKAKAFIDLSNRKANGEILDEKNILKHKNDVFRLATMLTESDSFMLPEDIQNEINEFCQNVSQSLPDNSFFKAIGVPVKPDYAFGFLCRSFQVVI